MFAKPVDNQNYRSNMALDSHSLEDKLRSPCREERVPAQEDHNQSNIKGILKVIKTQSAIAKSIAKQDIAQYVSKIKDDFVFFSFVFICYMKINLNVNEDNQCCSM